MLPLEVISRNRKLFRKSQQNVRHVSATAASFCSTRPPAGASSSLLRTKPDAETLVADVKNPLCDLFVDSLSSLHKRIINIVGSLCTRLQEY